jgi:hypothetical protein
MQWKAVTEPQPGGGFFFCNPLNLGASAQTYSCWGFEGPALIDSAAERSYSAQAALCIWRVDPAPNDPVLRGAKGGAVGGGRALMSTFMQVSRRNG